MRAALERSLELLEPLPPGPEHVETYGRMASLESIERAGRRRSGSSGRRRRSSLGEELGLRRELVRAYQWRGLMRCELGDLAGIEDLERGLAEAIDLRMPLVIPAYVNLADQVWRQRGPAAALEIQRTAIEFGSRRGGTPTWPHGGVVLDALRPRRWDELLRVAEEIRRVRGSCTAPRSRARWREAYAALVLIRRGAARRERGDGRRTRSRTRGRSRTRRSSDRRSSPRRSSKRRKATARRPSATSRSTAQ